MTNLGRTLAWLVTAAAMAGWALVLDWWATTDDAVRDALREARWELDDGSPQGARRELDHLKPLFAEGSALALDGDPTIPWLFDEVVVPAWRIPAGSAKTYATLEADAAAMEARYAELRGGSLAPVLRAVRALDPALTDTLPYDPLPPAQRWVVYERPETDAAAPVDVSRANFRLDEALRAHAAGPDVGFAVWMKETVRVTGVTRPPVRIGAINLPALPVSRTVTWWILGRTQPIEVWGTVAVLDGEDAAALLAGRTARLTDGPPAGTEARPNPGSDSLLDGLCAAMKKPSGCFDKLPSN